MFNNMKVANQDTRSQYNTVDGTYLSCEGNVLNDMDTAGIGEITIVDIRAEGARRNLRGSQ